VLASRSSTNPSLTAALPMAAAPARLAAWCIGRAPRHGRPPRPAGESTRRAPGDVLPVSPIYPVKTLSYPDIDPRQVTSATAGWQNPAASRLGSRGCRNYSHSSSPKSCKSAYGRWNGGVGRTPGRRGSAWAGHLATGARTSTAGWKRRAGNAPKADSRR
jgi:hypothetical protein